MMRVLVTGATGMLGSNFVKNMQSRYNIYATGRENFEGNPAQNFLKYDLLSHNYNELIQWSRPDVIIHCAALTNIDYCEQNEEESLLINGESVKKLLSVCKEAKIIYISTDAVFPINRKISKESDYTAPHNIYGKSKELGEKYILEAGYPHCIVRTTPVGLNINKNKFSFLDWIISSLKNEKKISLFYDWIFSPISVWHLIDELDWFINNDISGSFHISGVEPISKYHFGKILAKELNLSINGISKTRSINGIITANINKVNGI